MATIPSDSNEKQRNGTFSLENILSANHERLEHPKYREEDKPPGGWDEEIVEKPTEEGYCVECEGQTPLYLLRYNLRHPQTNLPKSSVKIARMPTVTSALMHSTG